MKRLAAVYFSGTGNTKYAVDRFCARLSEAGTECTVFSIESFNESTVLNAGGLNVKDCFAAADTVLIAYPVYGSDMPRFMREFLNSNAELFRGKDLITIVTQLLFSGDGSALAARLLRKQNVRLISSIHIGMPSNISDLTIFKLKTGNENDGKIQKANAKIDRCADKIIKGKQIKNGRRFFSFPLGFFMQRLWYKGMEKKLRKGLKIDNRLCVMCGKCVDCCPVKNIFVKDNRLETDCNCSQCYRCINLCPKKAISLFSKKKPKIQYNDFLK